MCTKLILLLAVLLAFSAFAAPILTLAPTDGALSGLPGDTVGWGFTLSNDDGFLVVTDAQYDALVSVGVFTPFITLPANFEVVDSITPFTQPFNIALQQGIGSYSINNFEIPGTASAGNIILTYDLFSV